MFRRILSYFSFTRLAFAAIVSLSVCVVIQNIAVSRKNAFLTQALDRFAERPLAKGDRVPSVIGSGADGRRIEIDFQGQGHSTLVFTAAVSCHYCEKSRPGWTRLIAVAAANHVAVALVAKNTLPEALPALADPAVAKILITDPTRDTYNTLHMDGVPAAALIDSGGVVADVWIGEIDSAKESLIAAALSKTGRP